MVYNAERLSVLLFFLFSTLMMGQNAMDELKPGRHQNLLFEELATTWDEGIPLGNMLEGINISDHHNHDAKSLFLGILFHQIPVAIALMTLLTQSKLSKVKSWLFLAAFGIMTPLGISLGLVIPAENLGINEHVILAVVVGIFLHISTTIIFETSENHKFNLLKLVSILVGCAFAFGLNWI